MNKNLFAKYPFLEELGIGAVNFGASTTGKWLECMSGTTLYSVNPARGEKIARVVTAGKEDYAQVIKNAEKAFWIWRQIPAPQRGWVVRDLAEEFCRHKNALGALITIETGKILEEGKGEVQEVIDICEKMVGLSRELPGMTAKSERRDHFMFEQWHPLGVIGIIDAFNFPMAVRFWNAAPAAICGNSMVFKPSLKTPLCAIATQHICNRVMHNAVKKYGFPPEVLSVFNLCIGDDGTVGKAMVNDRKISMISATGSVAMGKKIAPRLAADLRRYLLELGGNNALIVMNDADLDLAVRAIVFGAVGTAGQRCTTVRRVLVQKGIVEELTLRLVKIYSGLSIGDPLDSWNIVGPLVSKAAVENMLIVLKSAESEGGKILCGGETLPELPGYFVKPAIVEAHRGMKVLQHETFAPILYLLTVDTLEEAIEINNDVPQGLSSAIFTRDIKSAFTFLSERGSDCGIANVNVGTSGAEIGLAFGGEKETGGGREAGSDAWKNYMRRQTCTINWSSELPLSQGIKFLK